MNRPWFVLVGYCWGTLHFTMQKLCLMSWYVFLTLESLTGVIPKNFQILIEQAMSVLRAREPEHIIYDSCCVAKQQAASNPWFDGIGMCVDPWHFTNKHKNTDTYCQINCNAADYPELLTDDGKLYFNTSIAEQINVWLGGYYSICKEMLPVKYDFFLDEMIRLRNIQLVEHLRATGQYPHHFYLQ